MDKMNSFFVFVQRHMELKTSHSEYSIKIP
jgi:hypothetical protein